jgi:uncharacterized membrane protein YdjX (TVP38/TMEM64 family)
LRAVIQEYFHSFGILAPRAYAGIVTIEVVVMYQERLSRSGLWLILRRRIHPLTSSDLVSYAAGLAGIPVGKVMLGTLLGMAPLCWAQAYLADGIFRAIPQLLYPLLLLCGIYGVVALWIIGRLCRSG